MRNLLLAVAVCLVAVVSTQKKRFCPVMTWSVEFTEVKQLSPGRVACFPFCEETEGGCMFTTATRKGEITCRAFINRTDSDVPPKTLYIAMKFCEDPTMRPCGNKHCKNCFPCYHNLHRRARSSCGMKLIHLRYNHVQTLRGSDPDTCLHDCIDDGDCVWAENYLDTCDKFSILGDALSAPIANLTLEDLECAPE